MSNTIEHMGIRSDCRTCGDTYVITQLEQRYCNFRCKRIAVHMRQGWSYEDAKKRVDFRWGGCDYHYDDYDY